MNPFLKIPTTKSLFESLQNLYPVCYDKENTSIETKLNVILLSSTVKYTFDYLKNLSYFQNLKLNKFITKMLFIENQRLTKLKLLKPLNESALESILYLEDLQVIALGCLSIRETDKNLKDTFDFLLLDDCDNFYRLANLYHLTEATSPADLISFNAEITPSKPTYLQHRAPEDYVKRIKNKLSTESILNLLIALSVKNNAITAYTETAALTYNELSGKFLQELTLIKVGHLGLLKNYILYGKKVFVNLFYLEYLNAYLFWSCAIFEKNPSIRTIFKNYFEESVSLLRSVCGILKQEYDLNWFDIINDGEFPPPMLLKENITYIRKLKAEKSELNLFYGEFIKNKNLPYNANFYEFQNIRYKNKDECPSEKVITAHLLAHGKDFRYEVAPNPLELNRK